MIAKNVNANYSIFIVVFLLLLFSPTISVENNELFNINKTRWIAFSCMCYIPIDGVKWHLMFCICYF